MNSVPTVSWMTSRRRRRRSYTSTRRVHDAEEFTVGAPARLRWRLFDSHYKHQAFWLRLRSRQVLSDVRPSRSSQLLDWALRLRGIEVGRSVFLFAVTVWTGCSLFLHGNYRIECRLHLTYGKSYHKRHKQRQLLVVKRSNCTGRGRSCRWILLDSYSSAWGQSFTWQAPL